jgi:hypothetical protein
MDNIVYNYPKSSCDCYKCTHNKYNVPNTGTPTNMSVRNCNFPTYFECYDNELFRRDVEPLLQKGQIILNPQVLTQNYAKDFQEIECPNQNGCPKKQYASMDPRLISSLHSGQVQTLNLPPTTSNIKLETLLHDTSLDKYGQGYKDYTDVNAGQIMYYVSKDQEGPYFPPNFVTSATTTGVLYKDPMGAMKPRYNRKPLTDDNPIGPKRNNYEGGLSWIHDSLSHRQDLLSLQMRKINQERYEPRWFGAKLGLNQF